MIQKKCRTATAESIDGCSASTALHAPRVRICSSCYHVRLLKKQLIISRNYFNFDTDQTGKTILCLLLNFLLARTCWVAGNFVACKKSHGCLHQSRDSIRSRCLFHVESKSITRHYCIYQKEGYVTTHTHRLHLPLWCGGEKLAGDGLSINQILCYIRKFRTLAPGKVDFDLFKKSAGIVIYIVNMIDRLCDKQKNQKRKIIVFCYVLSFLWEVVNVACKRYLMSFW